MLQLTFKAPIIYDIAICTSVSHVIDNEKTTMAKAIQDILPNATKASIAVGYFYISGFSVIMDHMKKMEESDHPDHKMQILISPETDRPTAEALLAGNMSSYEEMAEEASKFIQGSFRDKVTRAAAEIKKSLEYMSQTELQRNAVKRLADMMRRGKVEVRVYCRTTLHAKMYIFDRPSNDPRLTAIVGSSNFSIPGIVDHAELNLKTYTNEHCEQLQEWFDKHWKDKATKEFTTEMIDQINKSWAGNDRNPREIYEKALLHTYEELPDDEESYRVEPDNVLYDFQKRAVLKSMTNIKEYGGVIIADVVGMGKSFVGSRLLHTLQNTNHSSILIICPPQLTEMWKDYMEQFDFHATVISISKLGRDEDILSAYDHYDVVLVDESHRFKNITNAYEDLKSFMDDRAGDSTMIMLTATPLSNNTTDLKNQLALFPSEKLGRAPPLNGKSLDDYFTGTMERDGTGKKFITEDGKAKVRELLQYVMVRRTRSQIVKKYGGEENGKRYIQMGKKRIDIPRRDLRNTDPYDINRVYDGSFRSIVDNIKELKLARYTPGRYVKEEYLVPDHPNYKKYNDLKASSRTFAGLIRTTIFKRMESSIRAFSDTIDDHRRRYNIAIQLLESGTVPVGKEFQSEIQKMVEYDSYNLDRLSDIKSPYNIEAFYLDQWIKDMKSDMDVFQMMLGSIGGSSRFAGRDDKLHKLSKLVRDLLAEEKAAKRPEKILIFSEYRATTEYIHNYLKVEHGENGYVIRKIDGDNSSKEKQNAMRLFDPVHNLSNKPVTKEIDILISTDVLSEGINLHTCGIVINYDFHWNPVRLIQRAGRIDRLGTEHEVIRIFNFLPTPETGEELDIKGQVDAKIELIRDIIGIDQKVLAEDEKLDEDGVTTIYDCDEDVLDSIGGSVLDMDNESEEDAEDLQNDDARKRKIEAIPFGVHGAVGNGILYVALSADETADRNGKVVIEEEFVRHYRVREGKVEAIGRTSFLTILKKYSAYPKTRSNQELYNKLLSEAWRTFKRESQNKTGRPRKPKHQARFIKEMLRLGDDPKLGERAQEIQHFLDEMMLANYQPYRSLIGLSKRVDSEPGFNDADMISELEEIERRYGNIRYGVSITKSRVLYGLMVGNN